LDVIMLVVSSFQVIRTPSRWIVVQLEPGMTLRLDTQ
jgi:hypothetical protein